MPERNHEVVIEGYVFPDTVTVTLANDEYINSRDYVSKELYESVCGANDVWQAENAKLRELAKDMLPFVKYSCSDRCRWFDECDIATCYAHDDVRERAVELGIEMGA